MVRPIAVPYIQGILHLYNSSVIEEASSPDSQSVSLPNIQRKHSLPLCIPKPVNQYRTGSVIDEKAAALMIAHTAYNSGQLAEGCVGIRHPKKFVNRLFLRNSRLQKNRCGKYCTQNNSQSFFHKS
ncbi:MAG: hypothetical protein ACOXZI_02360 [Candidatus Cryptobacteroides sp.]